LYVAVAGVARGVQVRRVRFDWRRTCTWRSLEWRVAYKFAECGSGGSDGPPAGP